MRGWAAAAAALGVLVASAAPAAAAVPPAPVPLTAVMVAADAHTAGVGLQEHLTANGVSVARPQLGPGDGSAVDVPATLASPHAFGASAGAALGLMPGPVLSAGSVDELAGQLSANGVGLSDGELADVNTLGVAVQTSAADWDSVATVSAANWVAATGAVAAGRAVPAGTQVAALPVGVWLARAGAVMKVDHPAPAASLVDVSSPQSWAEAVDGVWERDRQVLAAAAADGCDRELLAAAAGEAVPPGGCAAVCTAGGAYLRVAVLGAAEGSRKFAGDPLAPVWQARSADAVPEQTLAALSEGARLNGSMTLCSGAAAAAGERTPVLLTRALTAVASR